MQLILESCHVVLGYDLGMDMILDRVVLGRETECIPSHGIQHIIALHPALSYGLFFIRYDPKYHSSTD